MSVAIITDSTSDLGVERATELGISVIPLTITIDGSEYIDQVDLTSHEFYEKMQDAKDLPKSSMPTPKAFYEAYEAAFAAGFDEIVSIHISSEMSGTYNIARQVAKSMGGKIRVVDSLSTTLALGLLVERACHKRDEGLSADAIADDIESTKARSRVFFTPLTLENLVKGGRASRFSALAAQLINIKLIITVDENGRAVAHSKMRGLKRAVRNIALQVAEAVEKNGQHAIRLLSVDNDEMATAVMDAIEGLGIAVDEKITVNPGSVISTHVGIGAFGVAICPTE